MTRKLLLVPTPLGRATLPLLKEPEVSKVDEALVEFQLPCAEELDGAPSMPTVPGATEMAGTSPLGPFPSLQLLGPLPSLQLPTDCAMQEDSPGLAVLPDLPAPVLPPLPTEPEPPRVAKRPRLLATAPLPPSPSSRPLQAKCEEDPSGLEWFYRVNFTKNLHKKKRTYECGVLRVKAGKMMLLSEDGKNLLGRALNGKDKLSIGSELIVGQTLIEIEAEVPRDDFTSGRAFTSLLPASVTVAAPAASKRRFQPLVGGAGGLSCAPAAPPRATVLPPGALAFEREGVFLEPLLAQLLRPHQVEGLRFLAKHLLADAGCILADSMGLGKTLQALCLLWIALSKPAGRPLSRKAAVVCPSSLCANWEAEVAKWLGPLRLRPTVVQGGGSGNTAVRAIRSFLLAGGVCDSVELEVTASEGRLLIISYDQLRTHANLLDGALDLLICDEGHRLKSATSCTAKRLDQLRCRRRILLTGTPLQNNLDEFWCCCSFVQPNLLPPPLVFNRLFKHPIEKAQDKSASADEAALGQARMAELSRLTSSVILRRGPEILEALLPSRTELLLTVLLSPSQVVLYRSLCQLRGIGDGQQLHLLTLLRQLCNDPEGLRRRCCATQSKAPSFQVASELFPDDSPGEEDEREEVEDVQKVQKKRSPDESFLSTCRRLLCDHAASDVSTGQDACAAKMKLLEALLCWVKSAVPDDGVVVVSNFTSALACCEALCKRLGFHTTVLVGGTPVQKRVGLVTDFNKRTGPKIFLLSSKAGGVGLNIVGANRLVMLEPDWNPATDLQAMGRVWRQGQTKDVFIYRLATHGSLEEKILQRQARKQGLALVMAETASDVQSCTDLEALRRVYELGGYTSDGLPLEDSADQCPEHPLPEEAGVRSSGVAAALYSVQLLAQTAQ